MPTPVTFENWCPFPDSNSPTKPEGNLSAANAQACFWFSNGCTIGCDKCDGVTRGPIPNNPCPPHTKPGDGVQCRKKMPSQGCEAQVATNCDPKTRTVNTNATCGGPEDWYYYSPWRAPGSAPVYDSCGLAGGRSRRLGNGDFGADYVNTTHAKQGDAGSVVLPKHDSGTVWTAGEVVEVSYTIQANHGGGAEQNPTSWHATSPCGHLRTFYTYTDILFVAAFSHLAPLSPQGISIGYALRTRP